MKRCTECHSVNVRRSGAYAVEGQQHPFHSPYRCEDCGAKFWVMSRKTRVGAAAVGAVVATIVGLALAPVFVHRETAPSIEQPERVDLSGREDLRLRVPSLDEGSGTQTTSSPAESLAPLPVAPASTVR